MFLLPCSADPTSKHKFVQSQAAKRRNTKKKNKQHMFNTFMISTPLSQACIQTCLCFAFSFINMSLNTRVFLYQLGKTYTWFAKPIFSIPISECCFIKRHGSCRAVNIQTLEAEPAPWTIFIWLQDPEKTIHNSFLTVYNCFVTFDNYLSLLMSIYNYIHISSSKELSDKLKLLQILRPVNLVSQITTYYA